MEHSKMIDPELVNYTSVPAPTMAYLVEGRKLMLQQAEEQRQQEATSAGQRQGIGTQVRSFVKRLVSGR